MYAPTPVGTPHPRFSIEDEDLVEKFLAKIENREDIRELLFLPIEDKKTDTTVLARKSLSGIFGFIREESADMRRRKKAFNAILAQYNETYTSDCKLLRKDRKLLLDLINAVIQTFDMGRCVDHLCAFRAAINQYEAKKQASDTDIELREVSSAPACGPR